MLQTKNLVKIYKPKKGVPVTAINDISVKLPDKGMVFLLGKSGSGKSTLLNLLGGLDNYDSGEIIIKGVSSKSFNQSHFDSYRNTYVGFIFQEYNILEEFSVGANIALAIELQGRKAHDSEINDILKEVDLEGYGNRKPNELSGGQKQRVAIARALVKQPEIIMADEPTGALDSNTGKAIFDTLKKLSRDKLVIAVSHDRDFAEKYADRIIELADGRILSDVELEADDRLTGESNIVFKENTVEISQGYHLTEEDRVAINEYIDKLDSQLIISVNKKTEVKRFVNTDEGKIKNEDGSKFKLIKSKLPFKNAFKIGASGLKYKKFRLVMTIVLSCIAFILFGIADTFAAYNHIETCTNSLYDNNINILTISKAKKIANDKYRLQGYRLSQQDLDNYKKNANVKTYGVYAPAGNMMSIGNNINLDADLTENIDIFSPVLSGYGTINEQIAKELGFTILQGNYPDGSKNEVAISEYIFEIFKRAQYTDGNVLINEDGSPKVIYTDIKEYKDIIGRTLNIGKNVYKITAVVDTHLDIERYLPLTEKNDAMTNADILVNTILYSEFNSARSFSYSSVLMVGDGFVDRLINSRSNALPITEGEVYFNCDQYECTPVNLAKLSEVPECEIQWLGEEKTSLEENEIVIPIGAVSYFDQPAKYLSSDGVVLDHKSYFTDFDAVTGRVTTYMGEETEKSFKVVGFIDFSEENENFDKTVICHDVLCLKMTDSKEYKYNFAVGTKPQEKQDLKTAVSYSYGDGAARYPIQNSITFELDSVDEFLFEFAKVFMYIGLGFAIFAGIMLANFIGTSISYKRQEIGTLRAIGSRSNDVFRIFFAEGFIIAMINFILSTVGVALVTSAINGIINNDLGILITLLSFSARQVALLFVVSIFVAFAASFLPVKKIASKKPIDAIRDR